MARPLRPYLPGLPCHIIQRGNNRAPCFFGDVDRECYLDWLTEACRRHAVALHAYVLMTNHVHLLVTPATTDGVSKVMQSIGRRYVQFVNSRIGRTGTLWESRHGSSPVQADRHLLNCYRYIELNPVRAGLVAHPLEYPWSSHRANCHGGRDSRIVPHDLYLGLGATPEARCAAYGALFESDLDRRVVSAIRRSVTHSAAIGDESFRESLAARLGRTPPRPARGRPAMPRQPRE